MSLISFTWLHKIIRKYTKPIPEGRALIWKRRLSFAYAILAWNTFGLVIFGVYKGKFKNEETALSPGQQWASTLGIKNAEVYRFSGFQFHRIDGNRENEKVVNVTEKIE